MKKPHIVDTAFVCMKYHRIIFSINLTLILSNAKNKGNTMSTQLIQNKWVHNDQLLLRILRTEKWNV